MGTIIALGKGSYDGAINLPAGLTLWGACAAETVLRASVPSTSGGVVTVTSPGAELRNVAIGGSPRIGVAVAGTGASLHLQGVVVSDSETSGILIDDGADLTARELVVRDTRSRSSDRRFGRGLSAERGARADATRAVFERNRGICVYVNGEGSAVRLSEAAVRDTQSLESDGTRGRGLNVGSGASVEVMRAVFERNRSIGVYASDEGTTLRLSDIVLRDTRGQQSDGTGGRGLNVEFGANAEVGRGVLEGNREVAVIARDVATSARLSDVVIRNTQSEESDGTGGRGLAAENGASVELMRALLASNRELGVYAADTSTSLQLADVVIRDTESQESDGIGGRGLNVVRGAITEVMRGVFERNREVGVFADGASTRVLLSDTLVRDTQSQQSDGRFGRGVDVQLAASVEVVRGLFSRNRDAGVLAIGEGASGHLSDVVVRDTLEAACVVDSCPDSTGGSGAVSVLGADLSITRFALRQAALCGAQVARDAELDLSHGEVSGNPIGACIQVEGYDVGRLTAGVACLDNGSNLETTTLPVPESALPPE